MARQRNFATTERLAMIVADCAVFTLALWLSILLRFGGRMPERNMQAVMATFAWALAGFIFVSVFSGIYVLYNKVWADIIIITVIDQIIVTGIIMAATFAGNWFAFPRGVVAINVVVSMVLLSILRLAVLGVYRRLHGTKRVMALVAGPEDSGALRNFLANRSPRHQVSHIVEANHLEHVKAHIGEFETIHISAALDADERRRLLDYLLLARKEIFVTADFDKLVMLNPTILSIEDESLLRLSRFEIPNDLDLLKRAFDFLVALVGVVLVSPILLITALLVKLTSPGPVFYKQVRVTKGNREFEILKFRSMTANAEAKSGPVLATGNDARVTWLGKYLRSLRIDELPQLINVLRGDMSLVGPRPERPFFVKQFTEINPHYPLRHNVRAGVTGYAQLYGKYATDWQSKLNFDLLYIKDYSPFLDMKIMIQTIKILFDKVSSAGLEEADGEALPVIPEGVVILR